MSGEQTPVATSSVGEGSDLPNNMRTQTATIPDLPETLNESCGPSVPDVVDQTVSSRSNLDEIADLTHQANSFLEDDSDDMDLDHPGTR